MDWMVNELLGLLGNEDVKKIVGHIFRVLIVMMITLIILKIARKTLKRIILTNAENADDKRKETLLRTVSNMLGYVAFIIILMAIINPFIDVKKILVATGVLGLVISFGAQSLIKDVLTGIFLLFEGQYKNGDLVEINNTKEAGYVEELGLRVTKIRLINGKLLIVPNGEIRQVVNGNVKKRRVYESIVVSSRENPEKIIAYLKEVAKGMNDDYEQCLVKKEVIGDVLRDSEMTDEQYEYEIWKNQYEEIFGFLTISSLDGSTYGIKYTLSAMVEDGLYFKAASELKRRLAMKMYEEKVRMCEQQIVYKMVAAEKRTA